MQNIELFHENIITELLRENFRLRVALCQATGLEETDERLLSDVYRRSEAVNEANELRNQASSSECEEIDHEELAEDIEIPLPAEPEDARSISPTPHISEAKKVHEFVHDPERFLKYASTRFWLIRELVAMADCEPSNAAFACMVQANDMAEYCRRGLQYTQIRATTPIDFDNLEEEEQSQSNEANEHTD